ncbi:MAG: TIGR03435 family protein [Acidobacteriaceae bacterium]
MAAAQASKAALAEMPRQQIVASEPPQFEVASVRLISPSQETDPAWTIDLDASDDSRYGGGLIAANGFLINYIIFAYKIADTSQYPLIDAQLPKWAQEERFHLEARSEGTPTKDQIRVMMKTMLKDRFNLAVHYETRQLPVYALVLDKRDKPGPQLKPHPDDGLCSAHVQSATGLHVAAPVYCAPLFLRDNDGLTHMRIMDRTMKQIAGDLATIAVNMGGVDPRPVVDKTGLKGRFDINLEFVRESRTPQPFDNGSGSQVSGLTFSGALRKQAGLILVKEDGPVDVLVVDHVNELSEN